MRIPFDATIPVVRRATGEWVANLATWTWWVTLTFETPVSADYAERSLRQWGQGIARHVARAHVPIGYTREWAGGSWHLHALLAIPDDAAVNPRLLDERWKQLNRATGFTDIDRVNGSLPGAAYYLVKTNGWDFNVACHRPPRCRRTRCLEAPSAW